MYMRTMIRKSVLTAVGTAVLSAGALSGSAWASGEFFEPFPPPYPEGASYDVFVDSLKTFGLLVDSDDPDTITNNDRCDDDGEAEAQIALSTEQALEVVADVACEADPTGVSCAGLLVLKEAVIATETVLRQCAYQTALVDSAEIEAAYENGVKLLKLNTKIYEKQLEDNLLGCRQVVGLILPEEFGGQAEWVSVFVQERIDQFDLAIGDSSRVNRAQNRLNSGNTKFDQGKYEAAYKKYCDAYSALVCSDDDDDDCEDDDDD